MFPRESGATRWSPSHIAGAPFQVVQHKEKEEELDCSYSVKKRTENNFSVLIPIRELSRFIK